MGWKYLIALIFLIPACLADREFICPPKELVEPCYCTQNFIDQRAMVRCERISGNDVVIDVLNKSSEYGYPYLFIDISSIPYIPSNAFQIKKLEGLYIMESTMISLFNAIPEADSLLGFWASKLRLNRQIDWELFSGMPNLKNLTIESSPLKKIDEQFVEKAPKSLERIIISNCSISKLPEQAFSGMSGLIDIVMDDGQIKELHRNMFPSSAKIQKFSFKNQRIESLPEDIFSDMKYLQHIWLTGNLISQVSENVFKEPFLNIRSCLLDENPIKCNCSIRWITGITDREGSFWRNNFIGKCEEPKNLHGANLNELSTSDFQHCEGS